MKCPKVSKSEKYTSLTVEFTLENFRRFHKPTHVDIAPVTILVGDNSSGKTSFLAGLRYIIQSMSFDIDGSFNREPFFLGAYDQIAHYRGGRYGRSTDFLLGLALTKDDADAFLRFKNRRGASPNYIGKDQTTTRTKFTLKFSNEQISANTL